MKIPIVRLFILIAFVFVVMCVKDVHASATAAREIFVSASGSDSGDGSAKHPFATIDKAKKQLDKLTASGFAGSIVVSLSAGTHYLGAPLVFTGKGYANGKTKVVFRGDAGGETVISGGRKVTGWRREGGNLWSADVKSILAGKRKMRNLYGMNGRLTRSREPNGKKYFKIENITDQGTVVTLKQQPDAAISQDDRAELVVLQNWSISKTLIERSEAGDAKTLRLALSAGFTEHSALIPKIGMSCYLENSKSFLDESGEWYFDESEVRLYYYAGEGEDPNLSGIVAPVLDKLVVVEGAEDAPVRNITFENISFEHTDFIYDSRKYSGIQAGFYTREKRDPIYSEPAAIETSFAENITFYKCTVSYTGASGIGFGKGTRKSRVEDCRLYDIGGNGINVGHRIDHQTVAPQDSRPLMNLSEDWEKPEYAPQDNTVAHNDVEYCGKVNFGAVGIFAAFSQRTSISSNVVAHMPYTGISVGFRWNPSETTIRDNTIEYNHIFDVMNVLADGGGIYTLGYQRGTVIRKNLIHDVHRSKHTFGGAPNNGFFFDEGTTAIFVDGNIIYGIQKSVLPPEAEPIRFNQTNSTRLAWGTNYLGIKRSSPDYPKEIEKEILEKAAVASDESVETK